MPGLILLKAVFIALSVIRAADFINLISASDLTTRTQFTKRSASLILAFGKPIFIVS